MRRRPEDLPDPLEIAAHVKELDERLDACFLSEIAPALEESRRARAAGQV
jgi:hypothetical protein